MGESPHRSLSSIDRSRTVSSRLVMDRGDMIRKPFRLYLKVVAASDYLEIARNTLRKYTDIGYLRAKILPSGDRLYSKEWLDEFVEQLPDAVSKPTGIIDSQVPIIQLVRPVLESEKGGPNGG